MTTILTDDAYRAKYGESDKVLKRLKATAYIPDSMLSFVVNEKSLSLSRYWRTGMATPEDSQIGKLNALVDGVEKLRQLDADTLILHLFAYDSGTGASMLDDLRRGDIDTFKARVELVAASNVNLLV